MRTAGTEVIEENQTYADLGIVNKGGFHGQYPNPVEDWHKKRHAKAPREDYPVFLTQQRTDSFVNV